MEYKTLVEAYEKLESTSKRLEKTHILSELISKTTIKETSKILLLAQGRVFPIWMRDELGVASKLVLKSLSSAYGITKSKIEQIWKETGDLGTTAEKISKKKKQSTLTTNNLTITKVFDNLRKLAEIEGLGSVDRKINLISELLTSSNSKEAKYIIRTILTELRVGIGEGTIRDSLVWAFFPKIAGIFYYCPDCKKLVPANEKCIFCKSKNLIKKPEEILKHINKNKAIIFNKEKISEFEGSQEKIINAIEKILLEKEDKIKIAVIEDLKISRALYNRFVSRMEHAFNLTNDFSQVAEVLVTKGIKGLLEISLDPNKPIKVMLYQKVKDIAEAFEAVGNPAAFEYKYDGFRLQIHKIPKSKTIQKIKENKTTLQSFNKIKEKKDFIIKLYTRRLEDVTKQFPDVVDFVEKNIKAKEFIIDCEITGIDKKTGKFLPFQNISQRIKRKYEIEDIIKNVPVVVNVFDIMQFEGKNILKEHFIERRKLIEKIVNNVNGKIQSARQIITSDENTAKKFYEESLKKGNEGVMIKSLEAIYKPGSRVGFGVKLKPVMETLDLAITGAIHGEGKRSKWFSSFILSCKDKNGDFVEIGRVGTGIKEKEESAGVTFNQLTEMIKPLIIKEKDKEVEIKPEIIIEIKYEEIQKSPSYSSSYALRFPRVIRLRDDKSLNDVSTVKEIEKLYYEQRGRKVK